MPRIPRLSDIPRPCDDPQERAAARAYRTDPEARKALDRLKAESESWPRTEHSRQKYLAEERQIIHLHRSR